MTGQKKTVGLEGSDAENSHHTEGQAKSAMGKLKEALHLKK